jgi:hypothetical protein
MQHRDVSMVFTPEQHLLIRKDVSELSEWPSLDTFGPVNQVIGIPVI